MNKKMLVALVGLSALLLFACGKAQEMSDQGAAYVANDNDQHYFNKGTENLEIADCEKVIQETLRTDCANIVESRLLIVDAVNELDSKKCNKIKIFEYRDICSSEIQDKKNQLEAKKKKREEFDKQLEETAGKLKTIIQKGDTESCNEFEDLELQTSCKDTINFNKAQNEKNSTYCEAIKDEVKKIFCKEEI